MELRVPKPLEKICSRVIVKNIIQLNEKLVSDAKTLTIDEILFKFQNQIIPNLELWWSCLPLSIFSVRENLQEALNELTEVDPGLESIGHPVLRLFHFLLKTLTLEEVFLDRNYYKVISGSGELLEDTLDDESSDDEFSYDESDSFVSDYGNEFAETDDDSLNDSKDSLTSPDYDENIREVFQTEDGDFFPPNLSSTVITLMKTCWEFPITKLTIYGYFCPDIIGSLLEKCPNLENLSVSDINLNGKVLVSLGNNCPNLKKLKLVGCSASKTSCTKGFFKNSTIADVRVSFENGRPVPLSFPNLRVLDLGFRGVWSIKSFEFKKWILFYYNNLCLYNFDFIYDGAVNPFILTRMNMVNLKLLRINHKFIHKLSYSQLGLLLKSISKLRYLEINFCQMCTESEQLKAEENLRQITLDNELLKYSVEYEVSQESYLKALNPVFQIIGANVISISIEINWDVKVLLFDLLQKIFYNCPSMEILKLLFLTTDSISDESIQNKKFDFQHNRLRELWLHESEPWIFLNRPAVNHHLSIPWLGLLNFLQRSVPELRILSITVWDKVPEILGNLESDVTTFHLKHSPYRDETITTEQILKLVRRLPYLNNLYLEGIDWKVFWKVKNYLENESIKISWGSLNGWPECNWPCGCGSKRIEIH